MKWGYPRKPDPPIGQSFQNGIGQNLRSPHQHCLGRRLRIDLTPGRPGLKILRGLRSTLVLAALTAGWVAGHSSSANAGPQIVAVFDVESQRLKLSRSSRSGLSDYIATRLAASRFKIVPRAAIKKRIGQSKVASYKACYDESCQIEIGKELAADSAFATKIIKLGDQCLITMKMFDLRTAATSLASTAEGKCDEGSLLESIKKAVADLTGSSASPKAPRDESASAGIEPEQVDVPERALGTFALNNAMFRGAENAWVTIEAYVDFECSYCREARAKLERLVEAYEGDVRLTMVHYPLPHHRRAFPAAVAAECAREQEKFWEYVDLLYEHPTRLSDADFLAHATKLGLKIPSFKGCLAAPNVAARVESHRKRALRQRVRGIPAFVINGRTVGNVPYEELREVVEEELLAARESGVPKRSYYDRVVIPKRRTTVGAR